MAKRVSDDWISLFRSQLRQSVLIGVDDGQYRPGWFVGPDRKGLVRLQYKRPGKDHTGRTFAAQTLSLPYRWEPASSLEAMKRIREIFVGVERGLSLEQAAQNADARSSGRTVNGIDWRALIESYRLQKLDDEKISIRTWEEIYAPRLAMLLEVMHELDPPTDGWHLLDRLARKKEIGSTTRAMLVDRMAAFLIHCVKREGLPQCWLPPDSKEQKKLIGPRKNKRQGVPLDDTDLLELTMGCPDTEEGRAIRFALQVMAVTGCRPVELKKIRVGDGVLYSGHKKRSGGGETEERRLQILPVRLPGGGVTDFDITARLIAGEQFPDVIPTEMGERIARRVRYYGVWKELFAKYSKRQEHIVPSYCCRYRWIATAHELGIPVTHVASAAGHTPETSLQVYARFKSRTKTQEAFDGAVAKLLESAKA